MNEEAKKLQLKTLALKERLSQVITSYEDQIADLRVELTIQQEKINEMTPSPDEVTEGELVD